MNGANLGKWMLGATLVVLGAAACSDDDDVTPVGAAGSGGKGGSAGSAGKGGSDNAAGTGALAGEGGTAGHGGDGGVAGEGGAAHCSGGDCPAVDYCGPLELEARCEPRPGSCPTYDDIATTETCDNATSVAVTETTCGGKVVVVEYGLGRDTYGYDTDGTLEYVRIDTDQDVTCADAKGHSASTVWGELPCATTGDATEVCGAGGAGAGGAGGSGGAP